MSDFSSLNLLACIYANSDSNVTHNLIFKINSEYPGVFNRFLIIDTINKEPDHLIHRTLESHMLDFEYHNITGATDEDRGYLFKTAIQYAFENFFDFMVEFNEGWTDSYDEVMPIITHKKFINNSLVTTNRVPVDLNVGRIFNTFSNLITSIGLKKYIKDCKGDSINIYRVNTFVTKFDDVLFKLSDNRFYFWDILSLLSFHRHDIKFLKPVKLNTPSLIKLNTNRFFEVLKKSISNFFCRSCYVNRNKSKINPRTIESLVTVREEPELEYVIDEFDEPKDQKVQNDEATIDSQIINKKEIEENEEVIEEPWEPKTIYDYPLLSPQDVDPKAEIMRLDHINPKNQNVVVVNWCLTNICNFKCTYCPEVLHNGTERGLPLEDIKHFYEAIERYHPDKDLFFEFTGGEVTYYKQFPELIRYIKSKGGYVGLISNGSRKLDFWQEHYPYIDHICISFHSEQGEAEHFHKVVSFLCEKVSTHVNIMMKPENFDLCYKLAQDIANDTQVSISMQPLLEDMDGALYDYTEYQKAILDAQAIYYSKEPKYKRRDDFEDFIYRGTMRATLSNNTSTYYAPPEFISREWNRWAGWECYAGVENITVDMNGDFYRGWCKMGGKLGNAADEDLILPTKPIICTKSQCSCGQDIMSTKVRV